MASNVRSNRRVLYLSTGLNQGGAERVVVDLAVNMRSRGWDTTVVSMIEPGALRVVLNAEHVPVYSLHMKRGVPDPRAILRFKHVLDNLQPSIVHSHMVHANLLARVARLFVPIPCVICTAHTIYEGGWPRDLAYRVTDRLADVTTQVSEAGRERYVNNRIVSDSRCIVIPNGIDTTRYIPRPDVRYRVRRDLGIREREFVWISTGRLEAVKDHSTMLKAFNAIINSYPDMKLVLVGQGAKRPEIEDMIRSLGLHESVIMLGQRTDVPDLLNGADGFVLSSRWEGMPLALMEACAVGLPAVATNVGGNREVVRDGVTGYLVPAGDPEALAEAMQKLIFLPENVREQIGRAGRDFIVATYDLTRVLDMWNELYQRLCEGCELAKGG